MAKSKRAVSGDEQDASAESEQPAALSPHLDDQRARDYVVHMTPRTLPGRSVATIRGSRRAHTFRRGEGGDLTHTINLTPPQARDLRARGWSVVEKE